MLCSYFHASGKRDSCMRFGRLVDYPYYNSILFKPVTDNNVRLGIRYVDLGQNQMECGNYSGSSSDNLSTLYYGGDTHKNRHILYYSIYYTALCYMCRNERRRLQRSVRPRVWPSCFDKTIRIFHISKVNTGHKLLWKHEPFVYLQRISEKYLLIRIIFYIIYIIYIYTTYYLCIWTILYCETNLLQN